MILFSSFEKHPNFAESIYSLLDHNMPKTSGEDKHLSYRSKFTSVTREEFNSTKSNIPRTMGYMQTPLRPPQDFLKKHSREDKTDHNKVVPCMCRNRNPKEYSKIPKTSSAMADLPKKNYIQENMQQATKRPCTAPAPRKIDSRKGYAFELEESGWVPKYTNKEDYGKVPSYLIKIKRNLEHSRFEFERFINAEGREAEPQKLSTKYKEEILEGLVKHLKVLLKRYLKIPIIVDTPLKVKQKEEIERRMDALQRDIDLIRENRDILIARERPTTAFY